GVVLDAASFGLIASGMDGLQCDSVSGGAPRRSGSWKDADVEIVVAGIKMNRSEAGATNGEIHWSNLDGDTDHNQWLNWQGGCCDDPISTNWGSLTPGECNNGGCRRYCSVADTHSTNQFEYCSVLNQEIMTDPVGDVSRTKPGERVQWTVNGGPPNGP